MFDVTISIVLFHTNEIQVANVLRLINRSTLKKKIYLIDNSRDDSLRSLQYINDVVYIFTDANLGYGAGHNIAIERSKNDSKYSLIINSDIDFDPQILKQAFDFMESNIEVGMLSPKIMTDDGQQQYFCRRLPTPFDLFARRFIPGLIKPLFKKSLDSYLLLDKDYSKPMNIPNLPGCFMFVRTEVLVQVGGFDESFFLYVEDVDLTRRLHEVSVTLYYPQIAIVHELARGSYKLTKLVGYHIRSAIVYFNKWGWLIDRDRSAINKIIGEDFSRSNKRRVLGPKVVPLYKNIGQKAYNTKF